MANIICKRYTTITAAAGTVYTTTLSAAGTGHKTDISNNTDNDILISDKNSFTESASGSAYLTIVPDGVYNGLEFEKDVIYIKALGDGTISVVTHK